MADHPFPARLYKIRCNGCTNTHYRRFGLSTKAGDVKKVPCGMCGHVNGFTVLEPCPEL